MGALLVDESTSPGERVQRVRQVPRLRLDPSQPEEETCLQEIPRIALAALGERATHEILGAGELSDTEEGFREQPVRQGAIPGSCLRQPKGAHEVGARREVVAGVVKRPSPELLVRDTLTRRGGGVRIELGQELIGWTRPEACGGPGLGGPIEPVHWD